MPSAWATLLTFLAALITGLGVNVLIALYQAGKYIERVERLTSEVQRYQEEVIKLGRQIAAITGVANGTSYREGD